MEEAVGEKRGNPKTTKPDKEIPSPRGRGGFLGTKGHAGMTVPRERNEALRPNTTKIGRNEGTLPILKAHLSQNRGANTASQKGTSGPEGRLRDLSASHF